MPPVKQEKSPSQFMEHITLNFDTSLVREEMLDGEMHWVAPLVLMTECVANGSQGPGYYPADELEKWLPSWNHKPIVKDHPEKGSGSTPQYLNASKFGIVLNALWDKKQRAEAWLNQRRTEKVFPECAQAIRNKRKMEVSTGLHVDRLPETGEFGGKKYEWRAVNHRPDHLAVLSKNKGACSINDGAGLLQNEQSHEEIRGDLQASLEELYSQQMEDMPSVGCPYIRAVFDDTCIYWWAGKMYQVAYRRTDDEVSLVGEPAEVEQKVTYEPVGNSSGPPNSEIDLMPKKELIDKIIKNSDRTGYEESDRKMLDGLDEKKLERIAKNAEAPTEPKFKFTSQEELDAAVAKGIEETIQKDPKDILNKANQALQKVDKKDPPPVNNQEKTLTPEQWLSAVPPELKAVHNNMVNAYKTEMQRLVTLIVSNKKNTIKQEDLLKMDIDLLRNMAAMAGGDNPTESGTQTAMPNFFGLSPVANSLPTLNKEEAKGLPLPVYNFKDADKAKA